MRTVNQAIVKGWQALGPRFLPFADAATKDLPLGRLLRLSESLAATWQDRDSGSSGPP